MKRVNWWTVIAGAALALVLALAGIYMAKPGGFIPIPEAPGDELIPAAVVVVTPNGAKYHRESCSSLKNSAEVTAMTPEEAESEGYEPCMRCRPKE